MYLDVLNHCSNNELAELISDKEKFNSTCQDLYPADGDNQGEMMYHDLMEVISKRFVDLVCDGIELESSATNAVHDHCDPNHPDWGW